MFILAGGEEVIKFPLLDDFKGPDFHAPGGWDMAVEWQQQKVRDLLGPMLLGSHHLEVQPLHGQGIQHLIPKRRDATNGKTRSVNLFTIYRKSIYQTLNVLCERAITFLENIAFWVKIRQPISDLSVGIHSIIRLNLCKLNCTGQSLYQFYVIGALN